MNQSDPSLYCERFERAIIGLMLRDQHFLGEAMDFLKSNHFSSEIQRKLFAIFSEFYNDGKQVAMPTVSHPASAALNMPLDEVTSILTTYWKEAPLYVRRFYQHCQIVYELSYRRSMIQIGEALIGADGYSSDNRDYVQSIQNGSVALQEIIFELAGLNHSRVMKKWLESTIGPIPILPTRPNLTIVSSLKESNSGPDEKS